MVKETSVNCQVEVKTYFLHNLKESVNKNWYDRDLQQIRKYE